MGIDNTEALVLYQWLNYIVGHELTRIKSSRHPRNTKMGEVKIATMHTEHEWSSQPHQQRREWTSRYSTE